MMTVGVVKKPPHLPVVAHLQLWSKGKIQIQVQVLAGIHVLLIVQRAYSGINGTS